MPNVESAWSGRFVAGSVSMSLPILADYLSLGGSGFSSATNDIADLKVIGANLSIQASLSVPTTVPASFSGQTAVWYPDQSTNRLISNLLKQSQVPHSSFGRETCSGNCIRFDSYDKKASYRSRATSVLNSIPLLAVGATSPYFPGYSQLALLTYATGIYRDLANTSQACSF
jgi:hypothetical protein